MNIIKRDGRAVRFNPRKIYDAISSASSSIGGKISPGEVRNIVDEISRRLLNNCCNAPSVETIQDLVEDFLIETGYANVAKAYIRYRYKHEMLRNSNGAVTLTAKDIVNHEDEYSNSENANKNTQLLSTQRDYMAGVVSKDIVRQFIIPPEIMRMHDEGIIHIHDTDYISQHMFNCCLINLDDMLQNGTMISNTKIDRPKSFHTATNIATQIIAQVASNQYGGQTISLAHITPFIDVSRKKIQSQVREEIDNAISKGFLKDLAKDTFAYNKYVRDIVDSRLHTEIRDGVQTIQYQINTLLTTNGQTPFVTLFLNIKEAPDGQARKDLAMAIEEVLKQRIQGVKDASGSWVSPAFPKLIYCLNDINIEKDSPYYYLTKLAAKCTARRMVPDYISEKIMLRDNGDVYPCMGCRSFLSSDPVNHKYYGRFNQGVCTISLPDVALSAIKEAEETHEDKFDVFWRIFEERLEVCHKVLQIRHNYLMGTVSDVSPIHYQYGAIARLSSGETIDSLLTSSYSTISLGYAGLYECVLAMTGRSHTDDDAKLFALSIMQKLNDKCSQWKTAENVGYSVYGTPIESTAYKFATCLQKRFGKIKDITDRDYITNSYHVNVREKIDPFTKLKFESEFQKLSPGGAISYIETMRLDNNTEAVLEIMRYIYDHIMYAELNTKVDHCAVCGSYGEMQMVRNEDGKLIWECPNCGNKDTTKMSVSRRVCGYLSSAVEMCKGRMEEIHERVVHLGNDE